MTRTFILLLAGMLLLLTEASAQEPMTQSVAARDARGVLSTRAFPHTRPGEPVKCGLGLAAYAMRHRRALPPELQTALPRLLQRDQRQKELKTALFTIHYDTVGADAAAMLDARYQPIPGSADQFADSVAAIANRVYNVEVTELGYTAPPDDGNVGGGPQYDIYVENLVDLGGNPYYGETMPETPLDTKPDGGRLTSFMRIHNNFSFVNPASNRGIPGLRVTLAHEFHHMIQMGSYGFWAEDIYFHEITSTWMEDVVFPGVNDYLNYVRHPDGHFKNPDESFTMADGVIEYSRAIWGHFVAAKFGRTLMRTIWENIASVRPVDAMDQAFQSLTSGPSNFKLEFMDWVLWNYYTGPRADTTNYYPRGAFYPGIAQVPTQFVPPTEVLTGQVQALAAHYRQIYTPVDTVILIQTNLNVDAAEQHSTSSYSYTISLSSSQTDASYEQAGGFVFFKSSADDQSNWKTMKIIHGIPSYAGIAEGVPFPNPFRPGGSGVLYIPAQADHGTLNVYSSSMDLVYSAAETSVARYGKQVFTWDGTTLHNDLARSGVYVFVLAVPGKTLTGKIALIRK